MINYPILPDCILILRILPGHQQSKFQCKIPDIFITFNVSKAEVYFKNCIFLTGPIINWTSFNVWCDISNPGKTCKIFAELIEDVQNFQCKILHMFIFQIAVDVLIKIISKEKIRDFYQKYIFRTLRWMFGSWCLQMSQGKKIL